MSAFNNCRKDHRIFLIMVFIFLAAASGFAQQAAFPGAEGAGMFTTGGRGTSTAATTVFEVTNLSDDGLPGSLRYALTATATYRTVVFRVSGTIHLNSRLNIRANTTIAGQTAPGDGICVADYPVVINGNNVIVRYMRFRLGDKNQKKVDGAGNPVDGSGGDDAFGGTDVSNVIIDHCSVSWSNDEALTIYRGDNITVQWCFITEPLNYSYHWETGDTDYERHGYGGIWGGKRATMHHNLFAHCYSRNPRFAGISSYSPSAIGVENTDYRNNIIYNWGINTVYGGEGGNYNVVNNYYKYGPSTSSNVRYRIANPSFSSTIPYGKWFIDGNFVDGSATNTNSNWKGVVMQSGVVADTSLAKVTQPFDLGFTVTTHTAQEAYEYVLQGAGCNLPNRDTLDQRLANDVRNRTGRIIDVQGGYPHGTPYATTINAWPALQSTTAPVDDDHDGMPNSWETSHGLNPSDASDRNNYEPNGYTSLENYLNSLTNPTVITNPSLFVNGALNNFNQTIGTPSATQNFLVSGINLSANVVIAPPASFEVSADGGTTWFTNTNPLTLVPVGGTLSSTTITVRLNASATGSYSGNIVISSSGAYSVTVSVAGTASNASQNQSIGSFPDMDGGFEQQAAGAASVISTHTSTTKWESSAAFNIDSLNARTGWKSVHWNQASTSNKYLFTPVLSSNTLQSSTSYVVQFWYRLPNQLSSNIAGTSDLKLYGWSTLIGATGGTGSTLTPALVLNSGSAYGSQWNLFTGTLTTSADAPTSTYAGLRITYPQVPYFDIDDYVVYAGNAVDNTPPDAVTSAVADGDPSSNAIILSWSPPATGIDNGGYMVVRSNSATVPVPNSKGIYARGTKLGTDDTVLYIGTNTGYTDTNLSAGVTYYYYIFSVDKAYNYSMPVQKIALISTDPASITTSGTLSSFSQTLGTPSTIQSYTVSGTYLSDNITVTPPVGFEISANGGTSWYNNSSPLTLAQSGGTVSPTTISVRLNASQVGSYSGLISNSSTGASTMNVQVNGIAASNNPPPPGTHVVVAKDGSGNYTTIQAAIDAAPSSGTTPYIIFIRNGKYREKVIIPSGKPFIHLIGESAAGTVLSWDDYSGKPMPGGGTYGTSNSATLTVNAADCMLMNLTVENTTGDSPQALAININADRVVTVNCRFLGGQDTVLTNGTGRQYFKNSYIDGTVDFIFGSAKVIFDSCVIYPKTRLDGLSGSYITAANTPSGQAYGYVFRDCVIPSNLGTTSYVLGRPWQNDGTTSPASNTKVVLLNTTMGNNIIKPEGWSVWNSNTNTSLIYYGEYRSRKFDSSLVDISQRVPWSFQLTQNEAGSYSFANIFGSWDPCTVAAAVCASPAREIAIANFRGKKGTSSTPSVLTWNICWPISGVTYKLFRSSDNLSFSEINQQVSLTDTAVNFTYSEPIPPAGSTFYYYVVASRSGLNSYYSDTIQISSTPTTTVSGSLGSFLQGAGSPSAVQAYTVAGVNLTSDLVITPPVNFEISANGGATWYNSSSPLALSPTNNTVSTTTITVRLNGSVAGSYSGNIVHSSTGAANVLLPVSGTIQSSPLPAPAQVLQHWPFSMNNSDSADVRSAGVLASLPTFNKFYLSNGTQVPSIPAYSPVFGQAFGASSNGDGSWGTALGGPGSNLNRTYFEEFTVTAAQGFAVRVDSIVLTTAFYNSSSGTKLAVVYSKTGFVSDSANVTGGTGPSGALLSTANGGFTTPVLLANQTAGPSNTYSLALADAAGVNLNAGEMLTIRLYYSCGSTSAGRYAMLKNVKIKGLAAPPSPQISVNGVISSFTQSGGNPSASQNYTVSGTNLTGAIVIAPPPGFEVSMDGGSTWVANGSQINLAPVSGTVAPTTISVRMNASSPGNYSGDIIHETAGTTPVTLGVNGTFAAAPLIVVSGTLNPFTQTLGSPSAVQTYSVSGFTLSSDLSITPPAGYEVSVDGINWFGNAVPLTLAQSAGTVSATTVSVRLNATAAGNINGNIIHSSSGASPVNLAVSGSVVVPPSITVNGTLNSFSQTVGNPSSIQTYSIMASNLTGNLTITPPANYQVSSNGSNWFGNTSPLTITPTGGSVSSTISVRLNAATPGNYSGNILNTSGGASTVSVSVNGTTLAAPSITVNASLTNFSQTVGTPSAAQTYTIAGANLTGAVQITVPAGFELSLNGGTDWSPGQLLLNPVAGTVNSTILVRMNAAAPGNYSGNIVHTSPGSANVNLAINGTAILPPTINITGVLTEFLQIIGDASPVQNYTVSANSLPANLVIAPPSHYEISLNGFNWYNTPITILPVNGSVPATTIRVRLNAFVTGPYNGVLTNSSAGAGAKTIQLNGFTRAKGEFGVYPVPAHQVIFVNHRSFNGTTMMQLYSASGQKLKAYMGVANTYETSIDISGMNAGLYFIELVQGNEKIMLRFIKD